MGVRMRNASLASRFFGPGLAEPPRTFLEAGSYVRVACLRHPDIEALKDHLAHEPKWMKDGSTTLS